MPTLTTSQKVAIAVSVPIAAVALYVFLKWARDEKDFDDVEVEEEFATSSELVLEVKVAQEHVGAIIGRGGTTIKQIEKESQTRMNLKDDNEDDEGEEEDEKQRMRTILVRGSRERAKHAEILVRKLIAEQPAVETGTMEIPLMVIGRVIGKGGTTIRQLCRISGARIKIDKDEESIPDADFRICRITGTETQIQSAKQLLREKIDEDTTFRKKQKNLAKDKATFVQLPTDSDYFGVYVSATESPGNFWIQRVTKDSKQLDLLVKEMTAFYGDKDGGYRLNRPNIGDLCCAPFEHDEFWYRGEIIGIIPGEEVELYYLDFGDTGKVFLSDVKELRREFCELPFQGIKCSLGNIKPKDDKWNQAACDLFEKLSCCAQWKVLMARIIRYDNDVPCIELFDTNGDQDVSIENELVKQGYAVFNQTTPDKESKDSENPSTFQPLSPDTQQPSTDEKPITFQEANQQFQSLAFDGEDPQFQDTASFEFASPETNFVDDELLDPVKVSPLAGRTPVDEPTLSAVEHTVVSCADLSNLPNLLDFGKSEGIPMGDVPVSSSEAVDLQGSPNEMTSIDTGVLFPRENTLGEQEHIEKADTGSDVPLSCSVTADLQLAPNEMTSTYTGVLSPGGNTLGEKKYAEKDVTFSDVPLLSSAVDELREVPSEGSLHGTGILSSAKNTPGVQEHVLGNSTPEVSRLRPDKVTADNQSLNSEQEQITETVPGELFESEAVQAEVERVPTSPDSLSKIASDAVETHRFGANEEQGQAVGSSETERNSSEYLLRRSLSDDLRSGETFTNGGDHKIARSSSEMAVSPRRSEQPDEMDGKKVLSSKSLSSLEHLSKGNKRMMAAKFFQASNQSSEASENDGENEDDDDSLYLSAREDSDSFFSATGSRNNLRDTDSDVTPSGYLSDPDEDGDESLVADEMKEESRLDSTLLAEKLEQYADK